MSGFHVTVGESKPYSLVVSGVVAEGTCDETTAAGIASAVITENSIVANEIPTNICVDSPADLSGGAIAEIVIGLFITWTHSVFV